MTWSDERLRVRGGLVVVWCTVLIAIAVSGAAVFASVVPGGRDASFGGGAGYVRLQLGAGPMASSSVSAVVRRPDGKLVVAGDASDASGSRELLIARFDRHGKLDWPITAGRRYVRLQLGGGRSPYSRAYALAARPNGRLVVAGDATDVSGRLAVVVVRLDAQGRLDRSFGGGGYVRLQLGAGSSPFSGAVALAVQPNGKLVVGGSASDTSGNPQMLVARLDADGKLDASFGGGSGYVTRQLAAPRAYEFSDVSALSLQRDGKLVVAGNVSDRFGNSRVVVARIGARGSLDPSFGAVAGYSIKQLGSGASRSSTAAALAVRSDGRLVVAGSASDSDSTGAIEHDEVLLARFDRQGRLDRSFRAGAGYVTRQFEGVDSRGGSSAAALSLLPDGKLVVGGTASVTPNDELLLARFNRWGSLDRSFGSGSGYVTKQLGEVSTGLEYSHAYALSVQPDGKLVVAGVASDRVLDDALIVARFIGHRSWQPRR